MYQKKVPLLHLLGVGLFNQYIDIDLVDGMKIGLAVESNTTPPNKRFFVVNSDKKFANVYSVEVRSSTGVGLFYKDSVYAEKPEAGGIPVENSLLWSWLQLPNKEKIMVTYTFPDLPAEYVIEEK